MKTLISILLCFGFTTLQAQTTTTTYYSPDSTIRGKADYQNGRMNGVYKSWYDNGRKHWILEYKNDTLHGTAKYFNRKGKLVLEEIYENGNLTETEFQSKKYFVITGNGTFSSKVVGGAINEDGTSNVSSHGGAMYYSKGYLANVDSTSKPTVFYEFTTDRFGNYAVCVEKNKFGIFPSDFDRESITPGQFAPSQMRQRSGRTWWDSSLIVIENKSLHNINFSRHSVGYAP